MKAALPGILILMAACAGDKDSDGDSGATPTTEEAVGEAGASYPEDTSAEGIRAFLEEARYQGERWASETDAPREESSPSSPHDRVRVWLNDVVKASQAAGNGQFEGTAHETWSMAVKEMVDDEDAVEGLAVMIKIDGDEDAWIYYCDGPEARCGVEGPTTPYYEVAWDAECNYCHGGLIFNGL